MVKLLYRQYLAVFLFAFFVLRHKLNFIRLSSERIQFSDKYIFIWIALFIYEGSFPRCIRWYTIKKSEENMSRDRRTDN